MSIENSFELNLIIDSLPDGIFITDEKGTLLAVNRIATDLEAINADAFIGKHITSLAESGVIKEDQIVSLKVLETEKIVNRYKEDHKGRMIMTTGIPLFKDGHLFRVLVLERDITAITKLKQELADLTKLKTTIENELSVITEFSSENSTIVHKSPAINKIMQTCFRIAKVDTTVLITGESGTGKGVLAKYIHSCSLRSSNNFIKIDCTAIPATLFESELFGYEAGSFTGAKKSGKSGLIELADGGTLFIDEIGDLPLPLQTKLLSVLQEKKFYRVGGKTPIPVDIRIISATNRPLEDMVFNRSFREDLYYRLNVVPIHIPPLRERPEDIYPLAEYFLHFFNKKYLLNKNFSAKAINCLINYPWKGNVRELENTIERLVVTVDNETIQPKDLPVSMITHLEAETKSYSYANQSYEKAFSNFEKSLLLNTMDHCTSTKEMSEILKIAPNTITTKLKKYGITIPYKKGPKKSLG